MTSERMRFMAIGANLLTRFCGPLPFDLYLKNKDQYQLMYTQGQFIDGSLLSSDESKLLFAKVLDGEHPTVYAEKLLEISIDNPYHRGSDELREILGDFISLAKEETLLLTPIDRKKIEWAEAALKVYIKILLDDFQATCKIIKLLASRPYNTKHSFMVSLFSLILAKESEEDMDEKRLQNIALGALLHDIGMTRIDHDLINKPDLTPNDWKEIKDHPQLGLKIIDNLNTKITSEMRLIVLQHHEQPNGHGYPNNLHDDEIFIGAKIVGIADVFTSLICRAPYKSIEYNTEEALELMKDDLGHFDNALLASFRQALHSQSKQLQNVEDVHVVGKKNDLYNQ